VALDGLGRVRESTSPDDVLRKLTQELKNLPGAFHLRPRCALAVLYEPYAEGFQVLQVPTYGYLSGLAPGQPSLLIAALRLGSNYGLVDYLSPERLVEADLDGYSAILAPTALSLPPEVLGRLRGYVERGGRLVCDLGAGMYETGSWQALPEDLARLCGITAYGPLQTRAGDLNLSTPTPFLPSLRPPLKSRGLPKRKPENATVTPEQLKSWTFEGLVGMVHISATAKPVLIIAAETKEPEKPPPTGRRGVGDPSLAHKETTRFAGLIAQPYGLGWAAYCTAPLWARWDPADPFYWGFLGDLWAPRARWALRQPGPGAGVEMCAETDAVHLLNVSGQALLADVATLTEDNALYGEAFAQVLPPGGRETEARMMVLSAEVPPERIVTLRRRPVFVLPYGGAVLAHLRQYGSQRLSLELAGPGATLTWDLNKQRTLTTGSRFSGQVRVESGEYPVQPQSWHQVTVDAGLGHKSTQSVQADEQGRLRLEITGRKVTVEIVPKAAALSLAAGS